MHPSIIWSWRELLQGTRMHSYVMFISQDVYVFSRLSAAYTQGPAFYHTKMQHLNWILVIFLRASSNLVHCLKFKRETRLICRSTKLFFFFFFSSPLKKNSKCKLLFEISIGKFRDTAETERWLEENKSCNLLIGFVLMGYCREKLWETGR